MTCLLDPLRSDRDRREEFGDELDEILKDAIQFQQKKVRGKKNRAAQVTNHCNIFLIHHFYGHAMYNL